MLEICIVVSVSSLGSLAVVFCTDFYSGTGHKLEKRDDGGESRHPERVPNAIDDVYGPGTPLMNTCHTVVPTLTRMVEVALGSVVNKHEAQGC